MKCRNVIIDNGVQQAVFFGSYGLNLDGTAKKANNYVSDAEAIRASLIQRLSIIKGELWYNVIFGQPLFDKSKSKVPFDSFVLTEIKKTEGVIDILKFESKVEQHDYYCAAQIQSQYGLIEIEI